jgi:hypothetical protein
LASPTIWNAIGTKRMALVENCQAIERMMTDKVHFGTE